MDETKLPFHGYKQDRSPPLVKMNDISEQARQLVVNLTDEMQKCVEPGLVASEFLSRHGRSWGILRGFVLVLLHHNCPKKVVLSFVEHWHTILIRLTESEFFRVAKFLCAYPLARFCRNMPPDAPQELLSLANDASDALGENQPFPMTGDFRRWFRARLNKYSRVNSHLFMSWFQVKRAALPASPEIIDENLIKHRKRMGADDACSASKVSECLNALAPLFTVIKRKLVKRYVTGYPIRTVDGEVLPAKKPENLMDLLTLKASQSAAFFSTRADGGQAGELSAHIGQKFFAMQTHSADIWYDPPITSKGDINFLPGREFEEPIMRHVVPLDDLPSDLVSMSDHVGDRSGMTTIVQAKRTDHLSSQRFARVVDPRLRNIDKLPGDIKIDNEIEALFGGTPDIDPESDVRNSDFFKSEILMIDGQPCLRARVAVVVEPLKVRTVTAGAAVHYYLSSLFQRPYHDILREMPCFRLIGRTASPTDIEDIQVVRRDRDWDMGPGSNYEKMTPYLETPRFWYSADYEASTDLLSRFYSGTVFSETIPFDGVFGELRPLFRMALTAHVVTYPKVTLKSVSISIQQWETLRAKGTDKKSRRLQQRRSDRLKEELIPGCLELAANLRDENTSLWDGSPLANEFGDAGCDEDLSMIYYGFDNPSHPVEVDSLVGFRTRVEEPKYEVRHNRDGTPYRQLIGGQCFLEVYRALPPILQQNAQLMGSKLSFILLCLCNAGLYLAVRKRTDKRLGIAWTKERMLFWLLMVLINGDDLLTQFTQQEIDDFLEIGKDVGLRMSVGKVYQHDRYANINSTSFDCPIEDGHAMCVPYLNTGLFFGQNKVMSRVGGVDELTEEERTFGPAPHIVVMDEVLDGALPGMKTDLLKTYLEYHKDALRIEARGRNLFVSRSLGGWGCTTLPDWQFHITPTQQNEIARLYRPDLVPLEFPIKRKHIGKEIEDIDARPWKVVENFNEPLGRLRPVRKLLPMPPVDPTIQYVRRSLVGL